MSELREREDEARYQRYEDGLDPWGYDEYAPANIDPDITPLGAKPRMPVELLCSRCGHELKETDEGGCPECGGMEAQAA